MRATDLARCAVKHAGAAVVSETAPQPKHAFEGCLREMVNRGVSREKFLVIRNNCLDPRLLRHDLAKPNGVRIFCGAPWQLSLMDVEPIHEPRVKVALQRSANLLLFC